MHLDDDEAGKQEREGGGPRDHGPQKGGGGEGMLAQEEGDEGLKDGDDEKVFTARSRVAPVLFSTQLFRSILHLQFLFWTQQFHVMLRLQLVFPTQLGVMMYFQSCFLTQLHL